jgi:hypothetical protein
MASSVVEIGTDTGFNTRSRSTVTAQSRRAFIESSEGSENEHTHTSKCAKIYIYIYIYIYTHTHTHACIHIHTCIHTCIHAYTHACADVHTCTCFNKKDLQLIKTDWYQAAMRLRPLLRGLCNIRQQSCLSDHAVSVTVTVTAFILSSKNGAYAASKFQHAHAARRRPLQWVCPCECPLNILI